MAQAVEVRRVAGALPVAVGVVEGLAAGHPTVQKLPLVRQHLVDVDLVALVAQVDAALLGPGGLGALVDLLGDPAPGAVDGPPADGKPVLPAVVGVGVGAEADVEVGAGLVAGGVSHQRRSLEVAPVLGRRVGPLAAHLAEVEAQAGGIQHLLAAHPRGGDGGEGATALGAEDHPRRERVVLVGPLVGPQRGQHQLLQDRRLVLGGGQGGAAAGGAGGVVVRHLPLRAVGQSDVGQGVDRALGRGHDAVEVVHVVRVVLVVAALVHGHGHVAERVRRLAAAELRQLHPVHHLPGLAVDGAVDEVDVVAAVGI